MQTHKLVAICATCLSLLAAAFPTQAQSDANYQPTALVTGANRGLGLELARQYAEKGYRVIATARSPERAKELNALAKSQPLVLVEALDVTDRPGMEALGKQYAGQPIDILLNSAGVSGGSEADQTLGTINFAEFDKAIAVNTYGPIQMAEVFLPHVMASREKKIIAISSNMSSISLSTGNILIYRVSKTALNMAYNAFSKSLHKDGVIVGLVTPPRTDTRLAAPLKGIVPLNEVSDSATDIIRNIDNFTLDNSGTLYGYRGEVVPW